ncbi:unannotated protein [freshwater metagenome]|uniref:Unannotated protein n=1 Tax=freshwater metagenome TaxID=449393 RepID=A0A6J6IBC0_9ZZZZ|nr:hypothetical protein [Actinomycetota bacterium]
MADFDSDATPPKIDPVATSPWSLSGAALATVLVGILLIGTTAGFVLGRATKSSNSQSQSESSTSNSTTSTSRTSSTTSSSTTTASSKTGTRSAPIPVGQFAAIDKEWQMRVIAFEPNGNSAVRSANRFNDEPQPGTQWAVATIEAKYVGAKEKSSPFISVKAVSKSNKSFSSTSPSAVDPSPSWTDAEVKDVFQGQTAVGNVALQIDSNEIAGLQIYFSNFGSSDVYFATS